MPDADTGLVMVLTTFASREEAEVSVRTLVGERLAACGNLIPGITSLYHWKGNLETAAEVLVVLKTCPQHLEALQARLKEVHPYETPEILAFPVPFADPEYAAWVRDSVSL